MKNLIGKFYYAILKEAFKSEKRTEHFVKRMEKATGHKLTDEERQRLVKELQTVTL